MNFNHMTVFILAVVSIPSFYCMAVALSGTAVTSLNFSGTSSWVYETTYSTLGFD